MPTLPKWNRRFLPLRLISGSQGTYPGGKSILGDLDESIDQPSSTFKFGQIRSLGTMFSDERRNFGKIRNGEEIIYECQARKNCSATIADIRDGCLWNPIELGAKESSAVHADRFSEGYHHRKDARHHKCPAKSCRTASAAETTRGTSRNAISRNRCRTASDALGGYFRTGDDISVHTVPNGYAWFLTGLFRLREFCEQSFASRRCDGDD